MEAFKTLLAENGLSLSNDFFRLLEEDEEGAAGRRRVYGRLYSVWRAATGGRGRVVWPRELREAVREVVGGVAEEGKAGKYDSQYEDCPSATHLTIQDLAGVDWSIRPPLPGQSGKGKRKAGSGEEGVSKKKIK